MSLTAPPPTAKPRPLVTGKKHCAECSTELKGIAYATRIVIPNIISEPATLLWCSAHCVARMVNRVNGDFRLDVLPPKVKQ